MREKTMMAKATKRRQVATAPEKVLGPRPGIMTRR